MCHTSIDGIKKHSFITQVPLVLIYKLYWSTTRETCVCQEVQKQLIEQFIKHTFLFQPVLYSKDSKEGTKLTSIQKCMHITRVTFGNTMNYQQ